MALPRLSTTAKAVVAAANVPVKTVATPPVVAPPGAVKALARQLPVRALSPAVTNAMRLAQRGLLDRAPAATRPNAAEPKLALPRPEEVPADQVALLGVTKHRGSSLLQLQHEAS